MGPYGPPHELLRATTRPSHGLPTRAPLGSHGISRGLTRASTRSPTGPGAGSHELPWATTRPPTGSHTDSYELPRGLSRGPQAGFHATLPWGLPRGFLRGPMAASVRGEGGQSGRARGRTRRPSRGCLPQTRRTLGDDHKLEPWAVCLPGTDYKRYWRGSVYRKRAYVETYKGSHSGCHVDSHGKSHGNSIGFRGLSHLGFRGSPYNPRGIPRAPT